jgi:hypothetical protein
MVGDTRLELVTSCMSSRKSFNIYNMLCSCNAQCNALICVAIWSNRYLCVRFVGQDSSEFRVESIFSKSQKGRFLQSSKEEEAELHT